MLQSLLFRQTNKRSNSKILLIPASKPGKKIYSSRHNLLNSQCFSLSEREEKELSTGKVHFSETQTVSQRCPTPDNGNHTAGTNCLDLPTQKCVALPNATAPARAGDNDKREISAKNRQKSNSFSKSVVSFKNAFLPVS